MELGGRGRNLRLGRILWVRMAGHCEFGGEKCNLRNDVLNCSRSCSSCCSLQEFVMQPGSEVYENWRKPEVPMYFDIYFWDWTNPEAITDPNVRPNFVQRGPYVFLETHDRANVNFNTDDTITFQQKRTWNYIPEQSTGDFYTDRVTTPHTILMVIILGGFDRIETDS